jgi:hypothetical protein
MLQGLAVGGVVLALLGGAATEPLYVTSPPPNSKIVIDLVTVNGSGCPKGTTAVAVSPDNTAFTVTYSQYTAKVGKESTSSTDARKNCQLAVNVHVPSGFTYAVVSADYRGFAHLEKGASGVERANYYFQGYTQTTFVQHTITGPLDDDWQFGDSTDIASVSWAPCGEQRYLNINTELRAQAGSSNTKTTTSYLSMDSTDGSITTKYHLAWQACPKK